MLRLSLCVALLLSSTGCDPDPIPEDEVLAAEAAPMVRQELAATMHLELPPDSTFEERTHENKHWRSWQRGWGERHVTVHTVEYGLPDGVLDRMDADGALLQRYLESRHGQAPERREGTLGEPAVEAVFTRFESDEGAERWFHEVAVFRSGHTVVLLAMAGPRAFAGETFATWVASFTADGTAGHPPRLAQPWSASEP